jgi:serine/arginine repetitive matrix protein 2
MSYNNVGVATARGTGTNAYVARNAAAARSTSTTNSKRKTVERVPNADIMAHKRRRARAAALMEIEERLRLEGAPEQDIQAAIEHAAATDIRLDYKPDSHQLSADKTQHMARMGTALAINGKKDDQVQPQDKPFR